MSRLRFRVCDLVAFGPQHHAHAAINVQDGLHPPDIKIEFEGTIRPHQFKPRESADDALVVYLKCCGLAADARESVCVTQGCPDGDHTAEARAHQGTPVARGARAIACVNERHQLASHKIREAVVGPVVFHPISRHHEDDDEGRDPFLFYQVVGDQGCARPGRILRAVL